MVHQGGLDLIRTLWLVVCPGILGRSLVLSEPHVPICKMGCVWGQGALEYILRPPPVISCQAGLILAVLGHIQPPPLSSTGAYSHHP